MSHPPSPLMVFGNFVSDAVAGRDAPELNLHGMVQSSRKVWLTRPGDVLVTQFPVSLAFRRYACDLLGIDPGSVELVTAPPDPTLPLADAVERAGLGERLRVAASARPGIGLLPIVLDRPTVRCAERLGIPVLPYGPGGVPDSAIEAVGRLNTKCGFREVAGRLGIRIPAGLACPDDGGLAEAVRKLLAGHPRVLVKPARAAGGHGQRAFGRADLPGLDALLAGHRAAAGPQPEGWVVEERLALVRDVSVQIAVEPGGPEVVYTGEMRTRDGGYHGFVSPLPGDGDVRATLAAAGLRLGGHLAERGYLGRLSLDAGVTADGSVYALESNVRRTATTARHAMARRLAGLSGGPGGRPDPDPAWLVDTHPGPHEGDIDRAHALLCDSGLAYAPASGEGVVLSAETAAPGTGWHYAVIAPGLDRAARLERALRALLDAE
jgi:pre ATP-grasp domain-containing protein/pheganomycin biosynthesis PGM1-like protein